MTKVEEVKRYARELDCLSLEATQTLVDMVAYCLRYDLAMGIDSGFIKPELSEPKPFRKELELLVARLGSLTYNQINNQGNLSRPHNEH